MAEKPLTLWGLPVVISEEMPDDEIRIVFDGGGVMRLTGVLSTPEMVDGRLVLRVGPLVRAAGA